MRPAPLTASGVVAAWALACAAAASPLGPQAESSSTPTAALAADGRLWVVWVEGSHVYAGASRDLGRTFASVMRVNPEPEKIDANGEARPKIALGRKGDVYVSYTRRLKKPFTGDVRFSRSIDGGKTFSAPITVNDDGIPTGHRFDALSVSPRGDVHLFWIDKRHGHADASYAGAALYMAVSTDRGRTFGANRKVKDHVCECCRLAVAWDGDTPIVLFRDLMEGGVRDHSIARVDRDGRASVRRVTIDGWEINGCPHHGPSVAAGDGVVHVAWFTGAGVNGAGTFYRRSVTGGEFAEPVPIGDGKNVGRPQLAAHGKRVWLLWKETLAGEGSAVRAMTSADSGATWSAAREIARSAGTSDHPLLITSGAEAYLSWFTKAEGYRVVPLGS
jgi:hypothetical protein